MAMTAAASNTEHVEHVVEIVAFKFVPNTLEVKVGDTITWVNRDIVPHTATADDFSFDTGQLKQNELASITVTPSLSFSYICKFHPKMKATIIVE
jgi:plastocyanin